MKERLLGETVKVVAALTVNVTGTVTVVAPVALKSMVPLYVPAVSAPVAALAVTVPFPVPEAGPTVSQAALPLALHASVPPPVLLMLSVRAAGLAPPCVAVKERLVGLAPIAGLTEIAGAEGGEINCANPGISAANLLIDRPPALPLPEVEELPAPAAASGIVPVDAMPAAMDPVVVADDGATLMVARGAMEGRLPVFVEEAIGEEVVVSG